MLTDADWNEQRDIEGHHQHTAQADLLGVDGAPRDAAGFLIAPATNPGTGNATLSIDLAGLSASNGAAFTLMSADEIAGIFDEAVVDGLGGRDARIVVDYENDTVKLELTSGNGSVSVDTIGQESDVSSGQGALWAALTDGQGVFDESTAAALDEDDPLDSAA